MSFKSLLRDSSVSLSVLNHMMDYFYQDKTVRVYFPVSMQFSSMMQLTKYVTYGFLMAF